MYKVELKIGIKVIYRLAIRVKLGQCQVIDKIMYETKVRVCTKVELKMCRY